MRPWGNGYPALANAERMRSIASLTAASGSPTSVSLTISERSKSTSTSQGSASMPRRMAEWIRASTAKGYRTRGATPNDSPP